MLARILEPEVMDTEVEAVDYNSMDHSTVNRVFVDDFLKALADAVPPADGCWRIFDAGTGTALIPIELLTRPIKAVINASDLAEQMLIVARTNVEAAGRSDAIRLVHADCKKLPDADGTYDAVISNSIVHHIPEPLQVLAELWRVLKPGGLFFVRDLMRPVDSLVLDHLVTTYAGTANTHQQQMFRDSLHAALAVQEVRSMLIQIGIPEGCAQATSDRHWTISAVKRRNQS